MRDYNFRGRSTDSGEFVTGFYARFNSKEHRIYSGYAETDCGDYYPDWDQVDPETVGQFAGVFDTELMPVYEDDIVRFLSYVGTVIFDRGCFGIAINGMIDWDHVAEEMEEYAGTNPLSAVRNDNFISLWEILWNFNCDENVCNVIEVIGNIHDNPELLEGGGER